LTVHLACYAPVYDRSKARLMRRIKVYEYSLEHQNPSELAKASLERRIGECQAALVALQARGRGTARAPGTRPQGGTAR